MEHEVSAGIVRPLETDSFKTLSLVKLQTARSSDKSIRSASSGQIMTSDTREARVSLDTPAVAKELGKHSRHIT
jgi:hypothetical protein